jgi:hypothetical protein
MVFATSVELIRSSKCGDHLRAVVVHGMLQPQSKCMPLSSSLLVFVSGPTSSTGEAGSCAKRSVWISESRSRRFPEIRALAVSSSANARQSFSKMDLAFKALERRDSRSCFSIKVLFALLSKCSATCFAMRLIDKLLVADELHCCVCKF